MILAIQIRGHIGARQPVKDTLRMLHLAKKHAAVILEDTPVNRGMLQKVADFITYGEVSAETAKKIEALYTGTKSAHLHPPRGGFKSIKRSYRSRGDLGYRGEAIEELVARMFP
ncbi:MAG: uL30 family ribosomal protein [Candidatus Woesearchaeota archaeon]